MRNSPSYIVAGLALLTLAVSGCESRNSDNDTEAALGEAVLTPVDVSDASIVTSAGKLSGGIVTRDASDFSFPAVADATGSASITIPSSPPPVSPARRTVASGDGESVGFGSTVSLKYDMFSWRTGELVESSSQFEEAHIVKAGASDEYPIPDYLSKALLGRSVGDTIQVVLPVGTPDLPEYLDPTDAYVLLVEIL